MIKFYSSLFFSLLCAINVANAQWQALNGPPGANVRDMERTPNGTIYIVSNLQLFHSTNNGDSWQKLAQEAPASLDLEGITSDAAGNLFGVNYSRLYKSSDNGLNWEQISDDGDFYGVYEVQIFGPEEHLVIYGWNGVYVSTDAGDSWFKIWDSDPSDVKANAAGDLFISTRHASTTEGRIMRYPIQEAAPDWDLSKWQPIYASTATSGYDIELLIDGSSKVYAAVADDLIASTDNGATWSSTLGNITDTRFARGIWGLSPGGTIYLTNSYYQPAKIYSSADGGQNWTIATSPTDVYGSVPTRIGFGAGATVFLGSEGDGVFRSDNGGSTWTFKSAGLTNGNGRYVEVSNTGRILYLNNFSQKGYWTSSDNGVNWNFASLDHYTQKILKLSDGKILFHSGGPVSRSVDDGTSFLKVDDSYINAMTEDGSGNLYGADYRIIYKSTDQGDTWSDITPTITGLPVDFYSYYVALDQSNTNLFVWLYDYSVGRQSLYKMPVAGGTANLITEEPWNEDNNTNVNNMFVVDNKIYVAEYHAIYESLDGGNSWNTIRFSGSRVFPIPGGLCVSTNGAFYITQDGGKSWNSSSLPNNNALIWNMVETSDGFIAAALNSPALKYTGELIVPIDQLPPYVDFNWQPMEGPYGGEVKKVFSDDSQNTYALAGGSIFKTLTFSNWTKVSTAEYINDAAIDKANNSIYALRYNSLSKSTDGGTNWTTINTESIPCRQFLTLCANGDIAFSSTCSNPEIFISTDGGTTFGTAKLTLEGKGVNRLVSTSVSSAIFVSVYDYALNVRKLLRTIDQGTTWTELAVPFEFFDQIATDNNGNIFIWRSGTLYKSNDDGDSWTNITGDLTGGSIDYSAHPFVTPTGALVFSGYNYTLSKAGYWKTVNEGVNWTFLPHDILSLSLTSVGNRIVAGTQNGVYTSDDDGITVTERSHGINVPEISDLELISPSKLLTLTYQNNSYSSSDFQTWTKNNTLKAAYFFKNPDGSLIARDGRNLYKSADEGETWTKVGMTTSYINHLASANGSLHFVATEDRKIQYSNDLTTWSDLNVTGLPESFGFQNIAVNTSGFVFAVIYNYSSGTYEVYQILFGAAIKLSLAQQPRNLIYSYEDEKIILFDGRGVIFETTDGSAWTSKSAPSGDKLIISEKGYYFIQQWGGTLWLSRNKGQSWQNVGLSTYSADTYFQDVVVNEYDGHAYASLYNRVIHKSANIVMPPEAVPPSIQSLLPANSATAVSAATQLSLTFDEVVKSVAGKKIRILDFDNPISPVEIIDAAAGVQSGKTFTFTPLTTLAYEKTYFIAVDVGAFTDIFGNTFSGITSNSVWKFTTEEPPDATKPVITYSPVTPAFKKNETNKIQITVTDENGGSGVDPASVKMYYRGLMSADNALSSNMTNTTGAAYEVTVPDTWPDELGLEFKFEASDLKGNVQTLPADGSFFKGYIGFPPAANPTLPSSVISFGGQLQNYRIFSIPHKLTDAKVSTVFDEVVSQEVKTDFRILNYNTDTEKYTEYPSLTTITRGSGYWINIKNTLSAPIAIDNASTPENSKEQLFSITLKPGWNQIGNPYPFTISWNAVKTALANTNVGQLKTFNGSAWVADDKLNAFEGGFVLLNGTSNVSVPVPFSAKTTAGRTGDVTPDFEGGWWLPLTIENSRFQTSGGVGMHPEADNSFDQFDDAMPPNIFALPEILFPHTEHFIKHFTLDVVPLNNEYTWAFTVSSPEENAMLSWDEKTVRSLPGDLYLFDIAEQKVIDMREKGQHEISQKHTSFRISYGVSRDAIKPSRILLGKPYPNPFSKQSNVSFTLPENQSGSYSVSLEVFDVLGRKLATVVQGQFASGFYVGEWIPEPGSINASVCFYRLSVSDNNSNVVLTEKLLIQQ